MAELDEEEKEEFKLWIEEEKRLIKRLDNKYFQNYYESVDKTQNDEDFGISIEFNNRVIKKHIFVKINFLLLQFYSEILKKS